jgi:hypothetical protein
VSGFLCRRCDNVRDVGVPHRDRTPGHRARSLKATERAVTISFDVVIPSILGRAMWCHPLMYSRQYVDEHSRLWDITTCRLVRSHRRFGTIVVVSSLGPSSPSRVLTLR